MTVSDIQSARLNSLPEKQRVLLGIGFAMVGILLFSLTEVLAKYLGKQGYPAMQLVFLRNSFALLPMLVLVWRLDRFSNLQLNNPLSYIARAAMGAGSLWCFFYALPRMLLADVAALSFAAPIFTTALAPFLLHEKSNVARWMCVLIGFIGVLVIVRPTMHIFDNATSVLVLLAALGGSVSVIITRRLGRTEHFSGMIFYVALFTLIVSAMMVPLDGWRSIASARDWWFIAALGLVSGLAGILIVISYRMAPAGIIAPFDYLSIVYALALGYFLFGEWPGAWTFLGSAMVIGCGLYIIYEQTRSRGTEDDSDLTDVQKPSIK
jgi:drug/metabolite transporter (DMT)-like permease